MIKQVDPMVRGADTWLFESQVASAPFEISVVVSAHDDEPGPFTTLYVLDGNFWFPMTAAMVDGMHLFRELPGIVTVGIGYPVGAVSESAARHTWMERRTWDFFQAGNGPLVERLRHLPTGGAGTFLRSVVDEVIPWVEDHYPSDPASRTLFGASAGADFLLYALLSEPGAFAGWLASSPGAWHEDWDGLASTWHVANRASLFLGVGAEEKLAGYDGDIVEIVRDVATRLEALRVHGLDLTMEVLDGETHVTNVWRSLTEGLRAVIQPSNTSP